MDFPTYVTFVFQEIQQNLKELDALIFKVNMIFIISKTRKMRCGFSTMVYLKTLFVDKYIITYKLKNKLLWIIQLNMIRISYHRFSKIH